MGSSARALEWKFSQVLGERQPGEKVEDSQSSASPSLSFSSFFFFLILLSSSILHF